MPDTELPDETKSLKLGMMRFYFSDAVKVLGALVAFVMAWAGLESKLETINLRLDRRDAQENVYLRSDVQALRDQLIVQKLEVLERAIAQLDGRLERRVPTKQPGN